MDISVGCVEEEERGKGSYHTIFTTWYHLVSVHFHQVWYILKKIHLHVSLFLRPSLGRWWMYCQKPISTLYIHRNTTKSIFDFTNHRTHLYTEFHSFLKHFPLLTDHSAMFYALNVCIFTLLIIIFSSTQESPFHSEEHQINDLLLHTHAHAHIQCLEMMKNTVYNERTTDWQDEKIWNCE